MIYLWGTPEDCDQWVCEKDGFDSNKDKDEFCSEKYYEYVKGHNPQGIKNGKNVNRPPLDLQRSWVDEYCKSKGLGKAIPIFLSEYHIDVEWIESHLVKEQVKKDGRGRNPNSLKNLKQNRKEKA